MSAHTPTPWRIDRDHDDAKLYIVGRPVWKCTRFGVKAEIDLDDGADAEANAELIVRAVNSHEGLVKALATLERTVVELYRAATPAGNYGANAAGSDRNENAFADRDEAVLAARAALAKARGEVA